MLTASGRKPFRLLQPAWECLNQPAAEPIHLNEAKQQIRRIGDNSEDALIQAYITGARHSVETDTCRALCWQRWKLILDEFPDVIEGFKCPLIDMESVTYLDDSGDRLTVDSDVYTANKSEPWRVNLAIQQTWPSAADQQGSIEVTFTAGYLIPFSVDTSTETLSFTGYTPTNGDSFRLSNSGGQLPQPLDVTKTYYIVGASGSTCQLSLTSGGSAINLTQPGTGTHFLGTLPGGIRLAMLKHIATSFADREGSEAAANCEKSYLQSLRSVQYVVM